MSLYTDHFQQKHWVLTVGSGAWDSIALPSDVKEYGSLLDKFRTLRGKPIDPILDYLRNKGIKCQRVPGGSALTVSQYFAAARKEGSLVDNVSAAVLLGTKGDGPTAELTEDSSDYLDVLEKLDIQVIERRRKGTMPRCLYVVHPEKAYEATRWWEPGVNASDDVKLPQGIEDIISRYQTVILATPPPAVGQRFVPLLGKSFVVYNPGLVLRDYSLEDSAFKAIMPKAHVLIVNKAEAKCIMDQQLGYNTKGRLRTREYQEMKGLFKEYRDGNLKMVIVTLGAYGAMILERDKQDSAMVCTLSLKRWGLKPDPREIQSTIGCGDAFLAGCVEAIWSGKGLEDILIAGTNLASGALRHIGGFNPRFARDLSPNGTFSPGMEKYTVELEDRPLAVEPPSEKPKRVANGE